MKKRMKQILCMMLIMILVITGCMLSTMPVYAASYKTSKKVTKIVLNSKKETTAVGCSLTLKVKSVKPSKASKKVIWSSSDNKIATVSQKGVVKAKKAGTVTITAKSKENKNVTAKCKIKVYKATKKIKLTTEKSYTLEQGKSVTLKAKVTKPKKGYEPIKWSSKDDKIAKVNKKGKVTAVSEGETTIIGKSGKKSVKVTITVKAKEEAKKPEESKKPEDNQKPEGTESPEGNQNQEGTEPPGDDQCQEGSQPSGDDQSQEGNQTPDDNQNQEGTEPSEGNQNQEGTEPPETPFVDFDEREVITLDRSTILAAKTADYPANTMLKWDSFRQNSKDIADGKIPVEWLSDPVYLSMNLPSETQSDQMISENCDNAHIGGTMTAVQTTGVAFGGLYPTSGVELPENFTVCLGNIKLFAFSKSKNDWVIVEEQSYPTGVYIYTLPWSSTTSKNCENVTYYPDHVEVELTKEELTGNVLRFWGKRTEINREDYLYYASAYEFWIKDSGANNLLTATLGIDTKDADGGNLVQLFSSRGLAVTNEKKVHWGHTIPNSEYVPTCDGEKLQQLMKVDDTVIATFDTVADMIAAPLSAGSVVCTRGYHSVDDGGASKYVIKSDSTLKVNGTTVIALKNGLSAQLQITDNQVYVEQFGAYGDGKNDDVVAIQAAFDSGYTVLFSENRTYKLISNGLGIRNNLTLDGNGSTILVDGSYNPTNVDSFGKKLIRTSMQPIGYILFQDVNIEVDMPDNRYESVDYLSVFHPTFIDSVSLKSVNITVGNSYNSITNFWMDHGCQSLSLENCTFTNNTTHKEGGIIFLNSASDKFHGRYNAFDSVIIDNCSFNGTCGDEAIAIWGENDVTATIKDTVVNWDRVASGSSRPVNISSSADCGTIFDINFSGCEFTCSGIAENNNSGCDSFIGIGTKYASNKIKVAFDSCSITANVRDAFIKPMQLIKEPEQIVNFDFLNPNIDLQFSACNIVCDRPITGCNNIICPTTNVSTWPNDCSFDNCTIQSKYVFAFLEYYDTTKVFYTPMISVSNSEICIDDPLAFIYRTNLGAKCGLDLRNVNIKAESVNDIYTFRYNTNLTPEMTQKNADKASEYLENVRINGLLIE